MCLNCPLYTMLKIKLFVDIQNEFITGKFKSEKAVKNLPGILELLNESYDESKDTVLNIATCRTYEEDYFETFAGRRLPVKHCIAGTEGHKLNAEFNASLSKTKYHRTLLTYSHGSLLLPAEIDVFRHEYGLDDEEMEIEICGCDADRDVLAHVVILRNYFPETKITVYEDLCSTSKPFITRRLGHAPVKSLIGLDIDIRQYNSKSE